MTIYYPFTSELAARLPKLQENEDYAVWHSEGKTIAERLSATTKPIVEIGGPTDLGFFFLDGIALPSQPRITNISLNPLPYHPEAAKLAGMVTDQIDGTKMPYEDASIGSFLMSAMSLASDWWVELSDAEKEKASADFERESSIARLEMGRVATGLLAASAVTQAQRVKIFLEVRRCLVAGGLFFTNGKVEDVIILQKLGFELIACLQIAEDGDLSYEFVVAK